jgi:tripartite-type tricarboxylate transporter receptor subunit TctC
MKTFSRQTVHLLVAATILIVAISLSQTTVALAQDYPNRDITFIVPYGPGGGTDPIARQFCAQLAKALPKKVSVNVENKPGGAATIGVGQIIRAVPDGYTIGVGPAFTMVYQPLVNDSVSWKTPDDYQPITKLNNVPYVLAVRADAPWNTFEEFMADVRKNPRKIRAAVPGMRTGAELVLQLVNKIENVKITPTPFSGGGGEAMIALLGGRVEAFVGTGIPILGQVKAGELRVLAVFKKGKYELYPNATPVFDAAGYEITFPSSPSTDYVIAPKGMPKDVLDILVAASLQAMRSEQFKNFARSIGHIPEDDPKGPETIRAELLPQKKIFSDLIKFIDEN